MNIDSIRPHLVQSSASPSKSTPKEPEQHRLLLQLECQLGPRVGVGGGRVREKERKEY